MFSCYKQVDSRNFNLVDAHAANRSSTFLQAALSNLIFFFILKEIQLKEMGYKLSIHM